MALSTPFRATIAVTRHREPDAVVREAIRSALRQSGAGGEVLFLDQQPGSAALPEDAPGADWSLRRVACDEMGLSVARNMALGLAQHDRVLFLDADALAEPHWALALCRALSMPSVAVAGSRIEPLWPAGEPVLARSQVVRDQYSLLDLGHETKDVRRIVGAAFGVRRDVCTGEMRFDEGLGRRRGRLFGGEESDLCTRVAAAGGRIVYVGEAVVRHVIPAERTRLGWVWRRLFYAGHGRATLGGAPTPSRRPRLADWLLLPVILPPYAMGWLWGRASQNAAARPNHSCRVP